MNGVSEAVERHGFYQAIREAPGSTFNPWRDVAVDDAMGWGPGLRQKMLDCHLNIPAADFILIGEAPGFRGCRVTGVPFTSEALVLNGSIPRVGGFLAIPRGRMSTSRNPWTEPSATIMWKCLHKLGIAETTLLWNACPWHPPQLGKPLTNRAPTGAEVLAGSPALRTLIKLHPGARVVAVGNIAAKQCRSLGIPIAAAVRHPAYGGATEFSSGLAALKP